MHLSTYSTTDPAIPRPLHSNAGGSLLVHALASVYAEKPICMPMGSDLSEIQQLDILLSHTVSRLPYMVEHLRSDNHTIRQQQR